MEFLTSALRKKFEKIGRDEETPTADKMIIAKFFNPTGAGTWYATEFDAQDETFFGFVEIFAGEGEWGYFSLAELSSYRGPFGLGIERDLHFAETKFSELSL